MPRRRRIDSALEAIQLEQTRLADAIAELRRQVEDLQVPTPAEYQEQLLRTFHAGLARLETAQDQVLRALGSADLSATEVDLDGAVTDAAGRSPDGE